ncbi:MAG: ELWxxDGT repeat protein [Cyanobacteria bacterium J06628_3]
MGQNLTASLIKNINPNDSSSPDLFADVNGTLFFSAEDGTNGRELWKSDGTESGTVLVKDINPGSSSSISTTPFTPPTSNSGNKFADVNGTFYFVADDGSNGNELWKSDGTETGTVLVKDIISGSGSSEPENLTDVNGTLFFTVNDGSNGTELWKSDGTESGTVLVKDINSGENSSNPANLTNFDGILYFTADDGSNGVELWKSDGTADGTVLVEDINPGSASSSPGGLTEFDGELYFSADDGVNGRELWGLTKGGTQPNKDLILGGDSNDVLLGKEQDNIIDGLTGDDTLTGGAGKDKFVLSGDFGNDVITDFTLGEDEIVNATDRIVLTVASIGDAVNVAFSNTGDVLQVNLNGNEQNDLENYLLNIGSNQALPY